MYKPMPGHFLFGVRRLPPIRLLVKVHIYLASSHISLMVGFSLRSVNNSKV